jgi:hypothetical protein
MSGTELRLLGNCEKNTYQNINDMHSINIDNSDKEEFVKKKKCQTKRKY